MKLQYSMPETFRCPPWPPEISDVADDLEQLLKSGDWGRYKSTNHDRLRQKLGQLAGQAHVRLCGSGSAAVEIALRAAGVGTDDEVVIAAYDYPGNFRAIESVGAKPVLVDVAPQSLGIDSSQLAEFAKSERPESKVRAVLASHLYGTAAPVSELQEICKQREWVFVEDACQVPGMKIGDQCSSQFTGQFAGGCGEIATFSFGGSKPLTAGCGGAVLTSNERMLARMNAWLDRPSDSQPLSSLQATVLLPQLDCLNELNNTRRESVRYLESKVNESLAGWNWLSGMSDDVAPTHYKVAWAVESREQRSQICQRANELGVPIGEGFRSMARSSERRCRKPFPLENAARLGETVIVLDHAALLLKPDRHAELGTFLVELSRDG